ncbi:hypothetical protein BRD17_08445 [Halobacteriales archaeon SW_7_68_16]|nr:MAG: hypothetical protein BRD17_08445 [Halobacteriales archaeon SW_7_68_16]
MAWKRDFARGLVVVLPVVVTLYVIAWLYGIIASAPFLAFVDSDLLARVGLSETYTELVRVVVTLVAGVVLVFAVGYLMRTATGDVFEAAIDDVANQVPGLRVIYNASKMAAETALGGAELQAPVKLETWAGHRMTAFKTGRQTEDGREVLFLPTAPNITTGFVVEVDPDRLEESGERVEDALTRILSAGFGDSQTVGGDVRSMLGDDPDGETPDDDRNPERDPGPEPPAADSPGATEN